VGTDNGLFVSLDKGNTWQDFSNEIPNVAIHDLKIQAKAKELIVGTHGRSIYKIDISKVQQLKSSILEKPIYVFDINNRTKSERWGTQNYAWGKVMEPSQQIWFYSDSDDDDGVVLVSSETGIEVFSQKISIKKGLNSFTYNYTMSKNAATEWNKKYKKNTISVSQNNSYYLPVSKYNFKIVKGKTSATTTFELTAPKK
ncbi:MAG: glycosyl hydrolase, partial [Flavobacterium sp.]|nr:glycosyl hydrolase [Flavobacterium sp.]